MRGHFPAASSPGKPFVMPASAPRAAAEDPAPPRLRLFSNDNAKFYERKIVTSKSKSYLMGFMGASYKYSK
jgi:hypothetical protein